MNTHQLSLLAVACTLMATSLCQGGIVTPTSSNRVVSVSNRETFPTTDQSFAGPPFGFWQDQAFARNDSNQPNWNPSGSLLSVTSSQQSSFTASGVEFSGFVFIDYDAASAPNRGCTLVCRCDCTFQVVGSTDYQFNGVLSGFDFSPQQNEVSSTVFLRNLGTAQNVFVFNGAGTSAGTLATGDYTLSILIQGGTSGLQQIADARRQIDATFTVPAPAAAAPLALGIFALPRRRR